VTPCDRLLEILENPHAASVSARVSGQLDHVDRVREREGAREVDEEHHARLERCDQERLETRVVGLDLATELDDARTDLLAGEEDLPDCAAIRRL
jgi:hypothetical protein